MYMYMALSFDQVRELTTTVFEHIIDIAMSVPCLYKTKLCVRFINYAMCLGTEKANTASATLVQQTGQTS